MNENETSRKPDADQGAAFDEAAYTAFRNTDEGKRAYAEAVAKARRKLHLVTPEPAEPTWDDIPTELASLPHWVLRQAKIPVQLSGAGASSTDPATWTTFPNVKAAYLAGGFDGIGIVLSDDDDLVCWDFDHCLDADGRITDPKIEAYVERLASYTEVSPSGTGLHVFVRGKLPPQGRKNGPCEVYDSKRYMTVTGRRFPNTPATVNECQAAIDQVHVAIFPPVAEPEHEESKQPTREDAEILRKARGAANSDKLEALLAGGWEDLKYPSASEADAALARLLAFWTQDAAQIERMMRESKLYRDKWDRRGDDYIARTIKRALQRTTEHYAWERPRKESNEETREEPNRDDSQPSPVVTLGLSEFLQFKAPPREPILSPIVCQRDALELYAWRGIGKTWMAVSMAYTIASGGSFLAYEAPKPRRTLYVDGEMPSSEMQKRLRAIMAGSPDKTVEEGYFRIVTPDAQAIDHPIPNLAEVSGQRKFYEESIKDAEVVFFDNLSMLFYGGIENDAESWTSVQRWFLSLKRRGVTVILLHHAGKGGAQRGTSAKEDAIDTAMTLKRPDNYSADQGARFEIHYEKNRGFYGDDALPFEAQLEMKDGAAIWTKRAVGNVAKKHEARKLREEEGLSERAIAEKLEVGSGTIHRWVEGIEKPKKAKF